MFSLTQWLWVLLPAVSVSLRDARDPRGRQTLWEHLYPEWCLRDPQVQVWPRNCTELADSIAIPGGLQRAMWHSRESESCHSESHTGISGVSANAPSHRNMETMCSVTAEHLEHFALEMFKLQVCFLVQYNTVVHNEEKSNF